MTRPAVSVVVPAFNSAAYLEPTLATVAAQTFRDFELIVVDDGSTDDTAGVAERFLARTGLRGTCVRQANKKIAGARNSGIRASSGTSIAFLDADDAWHPEKLDACMKALAAHPEASLVCHGERILRGDNLVRVNPCGPWVDGMYERLLFGGNALSTSCVVVARAALDQVGGFREDPRFDTVEDYDLWMRLSKVCRFHFLDRTLADYRLHEGGVTRRVLYHNRNLEHLVEDHFLSHYGPNPGALARLRCRRRRAAVYRATLAQLMEHGEAGDAQREYALKMLRQFPFDAKNAVRAAQWAWRAATRRPQAKTEVTE